MLIWRFSRKECFISTVFLSLLAVAVVAVVVSGSGGRNVALEEDLTTMTTSETAVTANTSRNSSSFSVVFAILPDTQYYSEGAPYIFRAQTQWLVDHAHEIGSPFVMHLGDIIQSPWGMGAQAQWHAASDTMSLLEMANISYSIIPGNHDLKSTGWDVNRNHSAEGYLRYFGPQRAALQPTFRGRDPLGYSEYHYVVFTSPSSSSSSSSSIPVDAEQAFIVMALDWRASSDTLSWANSVLDKHPHVPTILTSHEYLTLPWDYDYNDDEKSDSSYYVYRTDYGESLWKGFIADRNEIFLVICGHINGTGYRVDDNSHGQPVVSVLIDYQSMHAGGNGYMRLMELDLLQGTMEHLTFSPFVLDLYSNHTTTTTASNPQNDFDTTLGPHDYAALTDRANTYTIPFNFQRRFLQMKSNNPNDIDDEESTSTLPLLTSSTSLLDPVRVMLAHVPLPPKMDDKPRPSDSSEYFNVTDSTLAHWRFDHEHVRHDEVGNEISILLQQQEQEAAIDTSVIGVVKDLSGHGNDLIRQDTADVKTNETDYLSWNTEHHPLSASAGSICFSNPTRDSGSFLATIPGLSAPLDTEDFLHTGGYTIEAFVRLTDTWDDGEHRWSGVVSRIGEGQDTDRPITDGDPKEPLVVLGFSELAEAQFAAFPDMLQDPEPTETSLPPSNFLRASHTAGLDDDTVTPTRLVTAWSSPIVAGQWYHIAAVNANGQTTRLYIDGYPARRDPVHDHGHVHGIATPSVANATNANDNNKGGWSIGSASYDGHTKVFGGCIGEVRIVGRALAPDEFLISRRRP